MDRVWTIPEVARELRVSPDRVRRTAARLQVAANRAGASARSATIVDASARARLHQAIGTAAATACGLPLSETELRALVALARAPRGVLSARAIARSAGISPTSAVRSLERLQALGFSSMRVERLALGAVRDATVIQLDRASSAWRAIAPRISSVQAEPRRRPEPRKVPNELRHLFWNTSDRQLVLPEAAPYVARRLVTTGDLDGMSWAAANLDAEAWAHAARARGLSARRKRLAENVANHRRRDAA